MAVQRLTVLLLSLYIDGNDAGVGQQIEIGNVQKLDGELKNTVSPVSTKFNPQLICLGCCYVKVCHFMDKFLDIKKVFHISSPPPSPW